MDIAGANMLTDSVHSCARRVSRWSSSTLRQIDVLSLLTAAQTFSSVVSYGVKVFLRTSVIPQLHISHTAAISYFDIRYTIYDIIVIKSYRCRDTERLANNQRVQRFVSFERTAQRKLMLLKAAESLEMLRTPPGNRLEMLRGDRKGQYSLRINGQWRLCFRFANGHAHDVEIVDYH